MIDAEKLRRQAEYFEGCEIMVAADDILALLNEVDRYREIRLGKVYIEPGAGEIYVAGDKRGHYCRTEDEFDDAVDAVVGEAAMQPEKEEE